MDLILPVNGVYFDQIADGSKRYEFRLRTPYWQKRLEGRTYDHVFVTRGYPRRDDATRRLIRPWRGYELQTIIHPHFGPTPVEVYAIHVGGEAA
ncbi:hypothetical protein [Andreprevotia chitinilytica]|uniref:hypothetical protein n=1 Tax=Andreprevotia chitinilytica TaxID=396808 RepID=UPI000551D696|nr:hypothetical protein [Andreprevotia chitinilytica]